MMKNSIFSIGLMSGTSLDGIDLVYVSFDSINYQDFKIIYATTVPYPESWKKKLQNAIFFDQNDLKPLDKIYGRFLGETINTFINDYNISKIDFIASHGHTVLHQPEIGITLQLGCGKEIAKITGKKVVYDFRTQDVKLGGQGAPLVPIGDELLFSGYKYCINFGGFSNISYKDGGNRIAFDICPVNIVLNHYVNKLGFEYDESGNIAASGKIHDSLLQDLNHLEFYKLNPPKSLGLEWVQKNVFPLIDALSIEVKDVLRTFVEHIAIQIASIVKNESSVLCTGGGVFNSFLLSRITHYTKKQYDLPSAELINYKEALIFALLGLLKINDKINCLKSVTGAAQNHSTGVIVNPV